MRSEDLTVRAEFRGWDVREARWSALGRLLPRAVRERLFEPAFADLLRATLERDREAPNKTPFAIYALRIYLGCVPPSLVQMFVVRGRPTRLARMTGVFAALCAAVIVVSRWVGVAYGY